VPVPRHLVRLFERLLRLVVEAHDELRLGEEVGLADTRVTDILRLVIEAHDELRLGDDVSLRDTCVTDILRLVVEAHDELRLGEEVGLADTRVTDILRDGLQAAARAYTTPGASVLHVSPAAGNDSLQP
jgi:hypothetical protein